MRLGKQQYGRVFEVRLAGILELMRNPNARTVPDAMPPADAVKMLHDIAHGLVAGQYRVLTVPVSPVNQVAEQAIPPGQWKSVGVSVYYAAHNNG